MTAIAVMITAFVSAFLEALIRDAEWRRNAGQPMRIYSRGRFYKVRDVTDLPHYEWDDTQAHVRLATRLNSGDGFGEFTNALEQMDSETLDWVVEAVKLQQAVRERRLAMLKQVAGWRTRGST
jgi:hypothetical protein